MVFISFGGRAIITGISASNEPEIILDGAIAIRDDVIVDLGAFDRLRLDYPEACVSGADEDVILPGFVNAHHHVGLTPFQLGVPDLPLELWLAAKIGQPSVDPYLDTLYSAFEMIASGVTTVQHLHVSRTSSAQTEEQAEAILRAYKDIGLRVSYSYGYRDQNRLVYEADETFLKRLPTDLREALEPWFAHQRIPIAEHIAFFKHMALRHDRSSDGRIAVQLAPSNMHWCSDEAIGALDEAARCHRVPMHMHLLETAYQKVYSHRKTGKGAVAHLDELGVLGPDLTLGHAVWVEGDDVDRIASSGTCVCHNASSNLRLRSGLAPCGHFLRRGIPVAIGIDEAGINDDRDMLQEMRVVLRLHGQPGLEAADAMTPVDVFKMATENGGRTTPFKETIGRIEVEKQADLAIFDWSDVTGPYMDGEVPVLDAIIYRAKQSAV